ncbi:MAG: hypothetical protein HZB79_02820 [Deltaproteobacteria bacterium]|nr:hypothetical protein [Deltaproteobacteria bacterium]
MKKILVVLLAVAVSFVFAGATFAAEEKKMAEPAKKAEPAKPAEPAKEEKKAPEKVTQTTGEVTAVDAKAMTVTVKGKKGDVTVTMPDAKMMEGVMVGDKVTCKHVEKEGKMLCKSLEKKAAAKKEEMKKEEKKEEKKEMKKEEKKEEKKH